MKPDHFIIYIQIVIKPIHISGSLQAHVYEKIFC